MRIAGHELTGSLGIIEPAEDRAQTQGQILRRIYPEQPRLGVEQKITVPWFCPKIEQQIYDLGNEPLALFLWGEFGSWHDLVPFTRHRTGKEEEKAAAGSVSTTGQDCRQQTLLGWRLCLPTQQGFDGDV